MTNSKTTKRALLSSTLALLMCVAMLIGTTFAWFTDTASTGINRIQSGNLDMEVYHQVGEDEWELIDGATDLFSNVNGEAILWEPGVTATETFKIVNKGNLAFKYAFYLNYANATKTADGKTLADVLTCGLTDYVPTTPITSLEDIVTYNYLLPGDEIKLQVYIKWEPTDHDNDYNVEGGLSIDLGVNVFATQYTYEKDSINDRYDADAQLPSVWDGKTLEIPEAVNGVYHITNAAEFVHFLHNSNTGSTYVLDCDIDLNGAYIAYAAASTGVFSSHFDGKNHVVRNFTVDSSAREDGYYGGLFGYMPGGSASIKNLIVEEATAIGGKQVGMIVGGVNANSPAEAGNSLVDNCHVRNCTVISTIKKAGAVVGYVSKGTVTNCTATDVNVYCADSDTAESGKLIGYVNTGSVVDSVTAENAVRVNVYTNVVPVLVSTAAEFAAAVPNGGTIILTKDIDADNDYVTAYCANKNLTIVGEGHKVTNLNAPLINFYGGTLTVKGVTVENSNVTANDGASGAGVIVEEAQWANLYMDDCHVANCTLTGGDTRGAAIVGYWIGGGEVKNCSSDHFSINLKGTAAGIVGHRQVQTVGGYVTEANIVDCTVTNSNISAQDNGWRVGTAIGTVSTGTVTVKGFTQSGNTLKQFKVDGITSEVNPNHPVYGRTAGGNIVIE